MFSDSVVILGLLKPNKLEKAIVLFYRSKRRGLQHWYKNWHHLKTDYLTASTFAYAVGFWPHGRTRLWLEKLGAIQPFSGNIATCWSNTKEQKAIEAYRLITGNTLSYPHFQVHPEDNWLAASPDGIIDRDRHGFPCRGVLEVKCPYFGGDTTKSAPWRRLPLHYIPQAQGLMEILDRDWMHMYVWTVNGSSLFLLERNGEYWELLKAALSDFWWKHVQPAREICSRTAIENPLVELRELVPAPKHDLHSRIVCESKRIVESSQLLRLEVHGVLQN